MYMALLLLQLLPQPATQTEYTVKSLLQQVAANGFSYVCSVRPYMLQMNH